MEIVMVWSRDWIYYDVCHDIISLYSPHSGTINDQPVWGPGPGSRLQFVTHRWERDERKMREMREKLMMMMWSNDQWSATCDTWPGPSQHLAPWLTMLPSKWWPDLEITPATTDPLSALVISFSNHKSGFWLRPLLGQEGNESDCG